MKIGGFRRMPQRAIEEYIERLLEGGALMPTERKRRRRANGEGSIYQRASDGKWVGRAYVYTTKGVRKRRPVYGNSFDEVREKLDRLKGDSANGVVVPDRHVLVREYLNHWLQEVVAHKRLTTHRGYESAVRLHLMPVLGAIRLEKLTGADVRRLIAVLRRSACAASTATTRTDRPTSSAARSGRCCGRTPSNRQIQFVHAVLRNALSSAEREELVTRNVAKLVQIPTPRYKVGKGMPLDGREADRCTEAGARGSTRVYVWRPRSACAAGSCWACAGRTSTSTGHGAVVADRAARRRPARRRRRPSRKRRTPRSRCPRSPARVTRRAPGAAGQGAGGRGRRSWQEHGLVFPTTSARRSSRAA